MKKRLLSVALTLCMALTLLPTAAFAGTDYGIWVGTTEVTSDNASNVLGNGTVTYDEGTNTLTLNSANIKSATRPLGGGYLTCGISKDSGGLNIVLHGANTIEFSADSDYMVAGIYTDGQLSIKGTSTSTDSLSVTNAFTTEDEAFGIRGKTGVTIEGCTVTATAGSTTSDQNTLGIYVNTGILSIKNAVVTGTGGSTSMESFGICTDQGSLSIENSTVTANGGDGTWGSYGLLVTGPTAAISNSTVTATGNSFALCFVKTPTVTGLTATASTDKTGVGATAVTLDTNVYGSSNTYKYVKIAPPPAQWGMAGSGGAAPESWVNSGTLAEAMSYANGLGSGTAYIQLLSNVNISAPLNFAASKTTILDLNGNDIDRGLMPTSPAVNGNAMEVSTEASLTLKDSSAAADGKITGGYNNNGGGGVLVYGSFTMQSGNITGNKSTEPSTGGGGVYVFGNFIMTGGSITDNEALYWGGGVDVRSGSFTMLGGSVTGNKTSNGNANEGGGVYLGANLTIGGTAVISGNTNTSGGTTVARNVCPSDTGKTISVSTSTPLTIGANIGVTTKPAPTSGNPVNITGNNSADYSSYFFSDNSGYTIQNSGSGTTQVVQLAVPVPVIGTLAISDTFTAGSNLTLSELDSKYKPSITENGATITAQGWQIPNGLGEWTNWSEGVLPLDTSSTFKLRYYATYLGGTVTSNEVTLTVVGNATTLVLTASPPISQVVGGSVTLTATLTGFFAGPGVNGHTITFKSDGTTLGTANLNAAGVAVFTWTPGSANTYALTAEYTATAYNAAAVSSTANYTAIVAPDIAIVAAAKAAAQNASYANMTQAAATNENAIKAALQLIAETAVNNSGISVTINQISYTAPIAGTSANPSGTNGSYTFTVTVSKGTPSETTEQRTITITATAYTASNGSGSGSAAPTGAPVIVDGKTVNIGTENKSGESTTVTVDQSKLSENIGGAASGSSVVVPVSENGSAKASLVVKNIEDMAAKGMTLTVQTGGVAYNLNTAAIDTAALTAAFPGADMSKVPFDVTITNSSVSIEGETLVLSPVTFTVTATYGGKTVDVDTFSAYIDRVIEVTKEQATKITTAVVVNADGSTRHVPTNVIEKDGKWYAIINSRTNSTYALIQNEVTFADAEGKWYEAAVNEMGRRKIIAGRSASVFDGDTSITRAEFAATLVRALGLDADGTSVFSDVSASAWYSGAVATAARYGLVTGKGDNKFAPNAYITRQEAMTMLQHAAKLTDYSGTAGALEGFTDAGSVGTWAQDAAKWNVGSGLIVGSGGLLRPNDNISRAESATVILRLLQKTGLVDVRSAA